MRTGRRRGCRADGGTGRRSCPLQGRRVAGGRGCSLSRCPTDALMALRAPMPASWAMSATGVGRWLLGEPGGLWRGACGLDRLGGTDRRASGLQGPPGRLHGRRTRPGPADGGRANLAGRAPPVAAAIAWALSGTRLVPSSSPRRTRREKKISRGAGSGCNRCSRFFALGDPPIEMGYIVERGRERGTPPIEREIRFKLHVLLLIHPPFTLVRGGAPVSLW